MQNIKLQRSQSLLKELVTEALSTLNNPNLNSLSVTDVVCSRGKYNAEVFIESSSLTQSEKSLILRELKKAESVLREYILGSSGWFKCPRLTFKFDESLKSRNALDKIFEQIQKERCK
ncbi:30S ribosome-binding factor RbfA [Helicobacter kayseriensis]|uniref:30S ribosome-binding factor RbfA n=1 Tax=Helicobacter kayseriensis TaxID=2905877 RepID=UPI001E530C8F|nr:30S ribosome-binding factor RbfA [Helicobacter kayseriensis]MCE3047166.1 30S ribosome-binding factor RbfA [Helicobacter kayseriensis]MCE3048537.1 30S ribosome-binding factor RbfA [Helicobacter kayseriensis]